MSVRVGAGTARGRRLRVPRGGVTRPTASVVRGALFDMLAHRGWLAGRVVVDLFAGSGALGIEAASRGAAAVVFVEESRPVARVLRANLAAAGLIAPIDVLVMPVVRALATLARRGVVAGGVIADPPYGRNLVASTVAALAAGTVLDRHGWIAVEHAAGERPGTVPGLAIEAERRYGATGMTIFRREEETG